MLFPCSILPAKICEIPLYLSVHIHLFSHNLNFGLGKISVCHVSFFRWKRWQLTTCWTSLCENPTREFWCCQRCTPHWPKSAWLDLPSCLDFVVLQASCSLCIHFLTNSVVINMQGITRIATVASSCLHDVIINLCAYSKSLILMAANLFLCCTYAWANLTRELEFSCSGCKSVDRQHPGAMLLNPRGTLAIEIPSK